MSKPNKVLVFCAVVLVAAALAVGWPAVVIILIGVGAIACLQLFLSER